MDFLRKFWPMAFSTVKKDVKPFVIRLVIYVLIGAVLGLVSWLVPFLLAGVAPTTATILGKIFGVIMYIVDLYCTAGIVFTILRFTGVFKDEEAPAVEVEAEEKKD